MSDNPWMQPAIPFPNQATVVDGVIPTSEVDQDPGLFDEDDEDLEMED